MKIFVQDFVSIRTALRVLNLLALMNNFEDRVLRTEPISTVLVGVLDLHRDKKS